MCSQKLCTIRGYLVLIFYVVNKKLWVFLSQSKSASLYSLTINICMPSVLFWMENNCLPLYPETICHAAVLLYKISESHHLMLQFLLTEKIGEENWCEQGLSRHVSLSRYKMNLSFSKR